MKVQIGTKEAHGKRWPLYERKGYLVNVVGTVGADDVESAAVLKQQLEEVLEPYGVKVKVEPTSVAEMTPEDRAEMLRLSEFYQMGLAHMRRNCLA